MSLSRRTWRVLFGVALAGTFVATLIPASGTMPAVPHIDKLVHALAFALLAWLGLRAQLGSHAALLAGLLVFGAAIELAQSFTPTRQAEWADLVADGLGALACVLATRSGRIGPRG
jgi:VanZ family protein